MGVSGPRQTRSSDRSPQIVGVPVEKAMSAYTSRYPEDDGDFVAAELQKAQSNYLLLQVRADSPFGQP